MNAKVKLSSLVPALPGIVLALMSIVVPLTHAAPVLWTGSSITFSQTVASAASKDVLITNAVSLTRAGTGWLFNPAGGDTGADVGTPSDTMWAFATNSPIVSLANVTNLTYKTFDGIRADANQDLSSYLIGKQMAVHLTNQDIYIPVKFTAWPRHGGRFAYIRSTPAVVLPTPTVSITNPPADAVFAEPANVQIQATAAVGSGSVTNVAFFGNAASLGSDQTAPFSITSGGLAAGPYALTAVATAAGVSTTSSVVNITIVSPVAISLTSQQITNNVFSFDYTANPGLRYVVQNSSNLIDWLSLVTNVATSNPVHYTDVVIPNDSRYYRVGRLPNP